MLLGESRILTALKKALKTSRADETLIAAQRGGRTTIRFARKQIHQNFHEEEVTVWVKVACGGRTGVATTCSLNHEALLRAVESALTIARLNARQAAPAFGTASSKLHPRKLIAYFPATVRRPLTQHVRMIQKLWNRCESKGADLAGSFVVGEDELAVAGSRGLARYQPFSIAGIRLVAAGDGASGFATRVVRDIAGLDPEAALERAWNFCRMNRNPRPIPLGKYDVLLEPEAVAELLEWLSTIGFGAKQIVEGTSFMAGRIGEKLMHRLITISDDGQNPEGLGVPFDYEGVPKQRVCLIERGVAQGVVYDSHYARLHRRHSTGHAPAYDESEGPLAGNLFMAPGETPYRDLLKQMDRGLWINRFHYVNGLLRPQEALMTGLTRDGTFLVKKGKVVQAVKNLRFTQSILEAFSNAIAASKERTLIADPGQGLSAAVVPALLLKDFTFTGQTR
ncbi:MAG: TldD/PmbA family protein [Candidatus Omnitrophica bacterium]|nr:TldD/PmbA family protein [Candidatus Omnitrophota bacterium]